MERKFKILRLTLGSYATNCYILFSNKEAIIIDPAAEAEKIIKAIEDNNLKPIKILLTHAHPDHFGALDEVRNHFGLEAYISKNDEEMLERRSKELNRMLGINSYLKAEHYYSEGDIINFSGGDIRVLETPGHTPGGVCLLIDDILISGDTLFYGSIGRTDLPGGDYDTLMSSLKKLTNLNDNILVLPGHGQETQIGFEKIYNPFFAKTMIKIEIENQGLAHEIYEFLRIIFPSYERGNFMCVKIEDELLKINSDEYNFIIPIKKSTNLQRYLKLELINQLKENQLEVPKWGVLHGIRPLKLIYNLLKDRDEEGVRNYLKKEYSVADEKINLAYEILNIQKDIISENIDNYSVYVHIPFCPSKCTYCSYHTLNSKSSMVEDYVNKLIEEIEFESKYLNKNPSSIYIGGGTPTSIGVNNLNNIIEILKDSFGDTKEFTVEAGRVETLTDEMIEMLSNNEVNRISINPQSMNLKTVKSINRINSIEELIECYNKAKPKFKDINMDLIIGLEDETEEDFINSLESVIKLNPTNITVHSLALKNGTDYLNNQNVSSFDLNFNNKIINRLKENRYNPYYLYRQKRIIGGNENIGYSIKRHECVYNIMMIQELHDIWGFGMGATSKLHINSKKFEQISNFRSMREYLLRNKEVSAKKLKVLFDRYRSGK